MNPVIWQYVGIFSTALAVILIGFLLWRRRELRRMHAMEVAETLAAWGFDQLARLFRAYAVGNYLGKDSVARVIHEIIDDVRGGGLPSMLRKIGWKVVEGVFLKSPEDRTKLTSLLASTAAQTAVTQVVPPPPTA